WTWVMVMVTTPTGGRFTHEFRFSMHWAQMHGGSLVESVSNLELSGPEAEILQQGLRYLSHHALYFEILGTNMENME
ncbi:hypothetical protein AVEN_96999-1, partial [Araneus ventricosus]